ncbi:MAG: glycosyltransferase [Bacteroidota bacterium]|nr:glycosyltransferase [Bacteroidota bacterium]MDP3146860.1 glycosyltransferase [Bacteroidota bacterium]
MTKPKIVIFMHWYLPGTKAGGPVRSVFSLVELLKNYFDFYIITSNTDLGNDKEYLNVNPNSLFTQKEINYYYFDVKNLNNHNLLKLLSEINPAVIYLNSFWSFPFSINIIRLKNKKLIAAPILLAPRGMLSKGALSLKSFKKNIYLTSAKLFGWYKNVRFHATNKQEEQDIRAHFSSANIAVASNVNAGTQIKNTSHKDTNILNLFFLSRISEVKNLHFALSILNDVPSEITINYHIYGNIENQDYWNKCLEIISHLPKNITVIYKGELAFNEVQNTISKSHCLFLPTLNENFGHSIVESLLSGCPVIISDQTPWNDLEKNDAGFSIPLHNKKEFLEAIIKMARLNQEEFSHKSHAANNYISGKIEIQKSINLYKNLFNEFIKN